MAEKVSKLGVKREPGFLYFMRGTDVWKAPLKRAGAPSAAGRDEKVTEGNFTRAEGYLYFLDKAGDVARAKRAIGGQKRKKSPARKSSSKPSKTRAWAAGKATAKKRPAAKKSTAKANAKPKKKLKRK